MHVVRVCSVWLSSSGFTSSGDITFRFLLLFVCYSCSCCCYLNSYASCLLAAIPVPVAYVLVKFILVPTSTTYERTRARERQVID